MVIFQIRKNIASFIMSLNNLEYNMLMKQSSVPGKQMEAVVPATYLVLVLTLTAMITVAELVLAKQRSTSNSSESSSGDSVPSLPGTGGESGRGSPMSPISSAVAAATR